MDWVAKVGIELEGLENRHTALPVYGQRPVGNSQIQRPNT
jgi:hypothetical protein